MNKYKIVIVTFIEPKSLGFEFSEWPNHITIVPPFILSDLEKFVNEVEKVCMNTKKIFYETGPTDLFGPNKDIAVSRIKESKELSALHTKLIEKALKQDKNINTQYCFENYKPHITHKQKPFPKEKNKEMINNIYIVKYPIQDKKKKEIIQAISLV